MNTRKQQLNKFYKSLNHDRLARYVWSTSYNYDYTVELHEYSPMEQYTDYASNHAHDVATANNDYDEFMSRSTSELWGDYKYMLDLWARWEYNEV